MSIDIKEDVDTNTAEFNEGVEAGLNSAEDTKNWKAGNALGQALKEEGAIKEPVLANPADAPPAPLFLQDNPDVQMGNAQDEKDAAGE